MKYIGIKEAAKKWGISDRRVRLLCQEGKIEGAIKLEWSWTIPSDAPKPFDGRAMRHYKNYSLRLGTIDITTLSKLKEKIMLTKDEAMSSQFSLLTTGALEFALELSKIDFESKRVQKVLSGTVVSALPLSDHLLYVNFRHLMRDFLINPKELDTPFLLTVHRSLTQGISDFEGGSYRGGLVENAVRGKDSLKVNLQMETLLRQFTLEWKALHPVYRAVIFYSEIMRIKPFEEYNELFAVLMLCYILLSSGYVIPAFDYLLTNEFNAATSLSYRRGDLQDLARIIERCLITSYKDFYHV